MLVIEGVETSGLQQIIGWMQREPLEKIIAEPAIQRIYEPLYRQHMESIDIIRNRARDDGTVVSFDLIETPLKGYSKFIPYYLYPAPSHRLRTEVQFSHQGIGRLQPLGEAGANAQPGRNLRTLWRRRPSTRRRHQLRHRRGGASPEAAAEIVAELNT